MYGPNNGGYGVSKNEICRISGTLGVASNKEGDVGLPLVHGYVATGHYL